MIEIAIWWALLVTLLAAVLYMVHLFSTMPEPMPKPVTVPPRTMTEDEIRREARRLYEQSRRRCRLG